MKIILRVAAVVVLLLAAFLAYALLVPSAFAPQAWQPASIDAAQAALPSPATTDGLERLGQNVAAGPETVAVDNQGRIYSGFEDGTIRRFSADGSQNEIFATTNGRPLGLAFGPALSSKPAGDQSVPDSIDEDEQPVAGNRRPGAPQTLYVADVEKGLLAVDPQGQISVLATGADDTPFGFTDDVDVAPNGMVYFSDASSKWHNGQYLSDIFEHGGHGRLLSYDPATGRTRTLLSGLQFANGVAVGPEGAFVVVSETGAYRVRRYWLSGADTGTSDMLVDNLPGFPDGVSFHADDSSSGRFWIALYAPRNPLLDGAAGQPWLRTLMFHLPDWAQPGPVHRMQILGVTVDGAIVDNLVDDASQAYAPVTSVTQSGDTLYLGSLRRSSFARLPVPPDTP